jgi:hypothetical protein
MTSLYWNRGRCLRLFWKHERPAWPTELSYTNDSRIFTDKAQAEHQDIPVLVLIRGDVFAYGGIVPCGEFYS